MEIALAITAPRRLAELKPVTTLDRNALLAFLGEPSLQQLLPLDSFATHLYFGSEYCEHLFPNVDDIAVAVANAERLSLKFVLLTPIANDELLPSILEAIDIIPPDSEVLANDWGVVKAIKQKLPHYSIVAGRQLAKMIKDPRMPSVDWRMIYPSNYGSVPYASLLSGFGIKQIELDVPPFATQDIFALVDLAVSVWAPYAYVAKGRICKIGSISKKTEEKFWPGGKCSRECLAILEQEPDYAGSRLRSYRRGTTMFYKYDEELIKTLRDAIEKENVKRLVLSDI